MQYLQSRRLQNGERIERLDEMKKALSVIEVVFSAPYLREVQHIIPFIHSLPNPSAIRWSLKSGVINPFKIKIRGNRQHNLGRWTCSNRGTDS